jgi:outer membrane protein assembly factor BamB
VNEWSVIVELSAQRDIVKACLRVCSGASGFLPSVCLKKYFLNALLALLVCGGFGAHANEKWFSATNLWKCEIGAYSRSSPSMSSNGVIYVAGWLGELYAINLDGTKKWVFQCGRESAGTPAIGDDGTIYIGSRNHRVFAVTPEGKKRWEFKTGAWVDASPAIGADGTIYVGSWDKKFYAINPDGTKKWEFETGNAIVSSAAIDTNGIIYFGSHDKTFYAMNPDGTVRWKFRAADAVTSSPAIATDGTIYVTSVDGKFHAFDPEGTIKWQLQTGGITPSSPVIGPDGVIYVSVNQTHCAVSPEGKFKWRRDLWHAQTGYFGETAATVLKNETVVFTGGDGFVMTVPTANGGEDWIWNYWLDGPSYSSPLVGPDGTVYVMSIWRHLHALQRHSPPATSPWPMFRANPQRNGRVNPVR